MASLDTLKQALRKKATAIAPASPKQPLFDTQYSTGFEILTQGEGWTTYRDFIIPQLAELLSPLFDSRDSVSVLEIGPGPKSVLGYLSQTLRQKITKYAALEPNTLFAARLEKSLLSSSEDAEAVLPCAKRPSNVNVYRAPFVLDGNTAHTGIGQDRFDIILFCHSMYGMKPKAGFVKRALGMLVERPGGAMVVVFHRAGSLRLDALVCQRTASFPTGLVSVLDNDEDLDSFACFIAGFAVQDFGVDEILRAEWRKVCRALGRLEATGTHAGHLLFSAPEAMVAFTQHAIALPELTSKVSLLEGDKAIKNREASRCHPAAIVRPKEIRHVQECVRWALKHGVSLTVIGGGHSGHCVVPNVVSIDMGAFDGVHIITAKKDKQEQDAGSDGRLVVVEAGCKTGDIIRKTMEAGVTVPLGSRPSVGAGLWLQGGIGHLARLYGLACDSIIGAVVVSVATSQVLCVGRVPSQHCPAGAIRPDNETDLLWAIKGTGTNVGIVISVTFKTHMAPTFLTRRWVLPFNNTHEAQTKLSDFDRFVARSLPRHCSADAYLYCENGQLHLGVSTFECSIPGTVLTPTTAPEFRCLGPENDSKAVDGPGLFESEMYISSMHGGHSGGKTSSFKRCVFLKHIADPSIASILTAAVDAAPSKLSYVHLLQGGEAVRDAAPDAAAFSCRDWDFACVITGVWPRSQDGTEIAQAAVQWVYNVARDLLPLSSGVYGADLGPDPRDTPLAARAFGPSLPRLAYLKRKFDPHNVLAYAFPLQKSPRQKLIVLVTGQSGVGKDYCADIWVSAFRLKGISARSISISDVTKREYATATGADLNKLLRDRAYKEEHRPALTAFFQNQVRHRPRLPEDHFLKVAFDAAEVDVLIITGMRDEAPVASLSHWVSDSRLLEIQVTTAEETRRARRGYNGAGDDKAGNGNIAGKLEAYQPSLTFHNATDGPEAAMAFAKDSLIPFFHPDLQRLASMARRIPNFPRPGIDFAHVLNIAQHPGGLALCASALQSHFTGDWATIDIIACCQVGGLIFAAALSQLVNVPLALIREAGKLPPPVVSVPKPTSHISISSMPSHPKDERRLELEMESDLIPRGGAVVVVDDVLATGETLCAVLQLLKESGVDAGSVSVLVVAEFPVHRGRALLRRRGFGRVKIQSLLVLGGA
ncbi:uncharacterized protein DSM5745_09551 [Aspergillus mulundensis]|uniref:FAD-binding PCMH-type domain-containing protein n=1 Tax=Aspergillus mulundensis TaxID=1810919 RepID=A0A3D8QVL2_9EURO|nr:Uncharacterized protein DSM5745_09551 [Aspergillus mulundensis]RDW65812.1 Uncharacterized protein DSM5745_09551 [Aspergillus mulundensis]